jgi:uncharacterized membrane protein HdeD (DUF308 family)
MMSVSHGMRARAGSALAEPFWQVTILGVTTVLFGVAVLAWPTATLHTLGILVGVWLLVAGVSRALGAFLSERGVGYQVLSGMVGVVLLVGGVACLRNVAGGVRILALMIALAWILGGLTEIMIALRVTGRSRTWLLALGGLSIAIGLVFLLWSSLSLRAVALLTGITALVMGTSEVFLAFRLRRPTDVP